MYVVRYIFKDLIDLYYKLSSFHITFWPYKYQQMHQIATFMLSLSFF